MKNWLNETKRYMQMLDSKYNFIVEQRIQALNEEFNIRNGEFTAKNGTKYKIAYIDPKTSENTYQYKNEIQKYGAKWMGHLKTWGWFLGDNPQETYNNKIKPCLDYLASVEQTENGEKRDVVSIIDKLLSELQSGNIVELEGFDAQSLEEKLRQFKQELVSITSDEEFKQKLLPIIKRRNAQGHQFSLMNAILMYIQDPEATLVKSTTNWPNFNRVVLPNAKPIALFVPYGGKPLSKEQKEMITQAFLNSVGKTDKKELTPGEKDRLRVRLMPKGGNKFKFAPNFYDIRFTEQMEGKEDVVGSSHVEDLPWYDADSKPTDNTQMLCDAMIQVIQASSVKVTAVKDLGGARGVSKSGNIEYLENEPRNIGMFNTLVHEFSHELLHQKYLKNNDTNPNGYGSYFIGQQQGRAMVEQQAELSAWIVCRSFGYDMPTNINYVGLWGMDDKAAPFVFDTVAGVATRIIKDLNKVLNNEGLEESVNKSLNENITGLEVAELLGCGELYKRYKRPKRKNIRKY